MPVVLGNAFWLVIAATALLLISSITVCISHSRSRRAVHREREAAAVAAAEANLTTPETPQKEKWYSRKKKDGGMHMYDTDDTEAGNQYPEYDDGSPSTQHPSITRVHNDAESAAEEGIQTNHAGVGAGVVGVAAAGTARAVSGYHDEDPDAQQRPFQAYGVRKPAAKSSTSLVAPGQPGYTAGGRVAEGHDPRLSASNVDVNTGAELVAEGSSNGSDGAAPHWIHSHDEPRAI